MTNSILIIATITIALGIFIGILIVALIYLQRRHQAVDSLVRLDNMVGCFGTVEVPFNNHSLGKVRVNLKGSLVDFTAVTDQSQPLDQGDRVVIVGVRGNKVWVVSIN